MQDTQYLDKFQAMQLAAILISAKSKAQDDAELTHRLFTLAEQIRKKDQEVVRGLIGNPKLGC